MSDRSDWLRSLVRRAADGVGERLREQPALTRARALARDLRARSVPIPERELARITLRLPGFTSSSVQARAGAISLEVEDGSGRWVRARIVPEPPRFATRGAKELLFRVEPPEAAGEALVREFVGALSAFVARIAWGAAMKRRDEESVEGAFVEREGELLHVDLRTVPSVRALASSPGAALAEAIFVERLVAEDEVLRVVLGLPRLG